MTRNAALSLLVCVLFAPPAFGFFHHLSPEQVREAYSIGRDAARSGAFFSNYIHSPKLLDAGPDVQLIEFRTPYNQVAVRARDNQWRNYLASDAAKDYETGPDEVIVRVLIYETSTFNFPASDGSPSQPDVGGFKFRVIQANHKVDYTKATVEEAVPVGAGSGPGGDGGIDIQLHFAASQFKSDAPVTIDVIAPTGQTYTATFNLAVLK